MSDPYDEIYETKREALESGKFLGAAEAVNSARVALSKISSRCESSGNDMGFAIAEECCLVLRSLAEMIKHNHERANDPSRTHSGR